MVSFQTTLEKFVNATIADHFVDLCLRKTRAGISRAYRDAIVFEKLRSQTRNRRFQTPPAVAEERFRKALFS